SGFTQIATTGTDVVLGWSPSSDDIGVVEYGVYRNLQRVATTSAPNVTLSGLACGSTYSYLVDAADAAGNRSLQASVYVRPASCSAAGGAPTAGAPPPPSGGDTVPPTTPTDLAQSAATPTGLSLTWKPSSDNVGVTGYDVYNNGSLVAEPTSASVAQNGLACG